MQLKKGKAEITVFPFLVGLKSTADYAKLNWDRLKAISLYKLFDEKHVARSPSNIKKQNSTDY